MAPTSSDLKQWVSHWSSAADGTRPGTSLPSRTSGDRKEGEVIILALGLLCHLSIPIAWWGLQNVRAGLRNHLVLSWLLSLPASALSGLL